MASKKTRLELTWIGKENRPKLEPRILLEDPEKSYHAAHRVDDNDIFDNRLIFGDNLLALKALTHEFASRVKCVYIDPPYNTGNAFEHYDDGMEHSLWLTLMRDRLELLRELMRSDGVILAQIDDIEQARLRLLMDEVFGASNFIATISVQMSVAAGLKTTHVERSILKICEYIHVYARSRSQFRLADLAYLRSQKDQYDLSTRRDRIILNPTDPVADWRFETVRSLYRQRIGDDGYAHIDEFVSEHADHMYTFIQNASSRRYWSQLGSEEQEQYRDRVRHLLNEKTKYEYAYNEAVLLPYYPDSNDGNLWVDFQNVGRLAESEGGVSFKNGKKPEKLLRRIIGAMTDPGDIVLDSFLGSGTTAAVAHKMKRRWIGIELGEHCHTHCIPRLTRVIDGHDSTGITSSQGWAGGGGFRYCKLASTLIVEDEWGNPVINPEYNAGMLTEAMCKLEGFTFDPAPDRYWQHGRSTESDFIYVTTQFMSKDMLGKLSDEVGPNCSLLICCSAFRCDPRQFESLTIKKIPKAVLKKCEWGHDDYSLEVINLPDASFPHQELAENAAAKKSSRKFGKGKVDPTLFDLNAAGVPDEK